MSHWGSVGVIARSMALNGVSSELNGDKWGSAGAQQGLSGGQWSPVGFSAQCIYTRSLIYNSKKAFHVNNNYLQTQKRNIGCFSLCM